MPSEPAPNPPPRKARAWRFQKDPIDDEGFQDAGIEHYTGARDGALYRECVQNSLDAHNGKTVTVEIEVVDMPRGGFSGMQLADRLEWAARSPFAEQDGKALFQSGADLIRADETVTTLVITDGGTTGTRDESDDSKLSPWRALTRGSGYSVKTSNQAMGSFGIGKNAPYACTPLRTVLYATCYQDDSGSLTRRFAGRTILVTHHDASGTRWAARGYLNLDRRDVSEAGYGTIFRLREPGTAVFVPGYKPSDDWEKTVTEQIVSNFFYAIQHDRLHVQAMGKSKPLGQKRPDFTIDSARLEELATEECSEETQSYVRVCGHKAVAETNIPGIGKVRLHLSVDDNEPRRRSFAFVRSPGMMLTDKAANLGGAVPKRLPRSWKPFTAVVVCEPRCDDDWIIRGCENAAHDSISVDHVTDRDGQTRKTARTALNKLRSWLKEEIKKYADPGLTQASSDVAILAEMGLVVEDAEGDSGKRGGTAHKIKLLPPRRQKRGSLQTRLDFGDPADSPQPDDDGDDSEETDSPQASPTPPDPNPNSIAAKTGPISKPHKPSTAAHIDLQPIWAPVFDAAGRRETHAIAVSFQPPPPLGEIKQEEALRLALKAVGEDGGEQRVRIRDARLIGSALKDAKLTADAGAVLIPAEVCGHPGRLRAELRTAEPVGNSSYHLRITRT